MYVQASAGEGILGGIVPGREESFSGRGSFHRFHLQR